MMDMYVQQVQHHGPDFTRETGDVVRNTEARSDVYQELPYVHLGRHGGSCTRRRRGLLLCLRGRQLEQSQHPRSRLLYSSEGIRDIRLGRPRVFHDSTQPCGLHHFQRQLWFHTQHISASTSHPEQCRRKLHKSVLASSTTAACYFCMVLTQQLRWSFAVLAIVHMGVALSGLCITRMWMYTQDPRLMQESSEMLAFVNFLERPTGHAAACCVVMSTPIVGVLLALLRKPGTAVKILIAGAAALSLLISVVFWVCGRSLMRAIDKSLQAHAMATEVAGQPSKRSGGDLALLGSRKKITSLIIFVVLQVIVFDPVLLFAVFSRYGEEAPLLLFGVVLGIMPPIWQMVGVQIFAGRSRVRRSEWHMARGIQGTGRSLGRPTSPGLAMMKSLVRNTHQVVPIEAS